MFQTQHLIVFKGLAGMILMTFASQAGTTAILAASTLDPWALLYGISLSFFAKELTQIGRKLLPVR